MEVQALRLDNKPFELRTNHDLTDHAFTTRQLADLRLPGAPSSAEGWRGIALSEGWLCLEHPGRGRGGIRRQYVPPQPLLRLILRHLRGEPVSEEDVRAARARVVTRLNTGSAQAGGVADDSGRQHYQAHASGADQAVERELTLRLGLLTHETDWLPDDLDLAARSALALRAYAALDGACGDEAALAAIAARPTALELALRLAWEASRNGAER